MVRVVVSRETTPQADETVCVLDADMGNRNLNKGDRIAMDCATLFFRMVVLSDAARSETASIAR